MAQTKKNIRLSREQRREQIIDAALKVFSQKGYGGARTKDIARLAGISETLLFQHFGNKHNLYMQSLENLFAHHPVLPELAEYMEKGDDYNVLAQLARHMIGHARRDPRMIRMILFAALEGMTMDHHHAEENPGSSPDPVLWGIVEYFKARAAAGAYRQVNIELAVRMFFYSAWMYAADRELTFLGQMEEMADEDAVRDMVGIFLDGLKKE